jgi:hypothetical protein
VPAAHGLFGLDDVDGSAAARLGDRAPTHHAAGASHHDRPASTDDHNNEPDEQDRGENVEGRHHALPAAVALDRLLERAKASRTARITSVRLVVPELADRNPDARVTMSA